MGLMGCGGVIQETFFPAGLILSGNIIFLRGGKTCLNFGDDSQL